MSVQLFKDGREIYVSPTSLKNHLDAGWSFHPAIEEKMDEGNELETLREIAKNRKIKSWHLLGIDKLKELLADEHED